MTALINKGLRELQDAKRQESIERVRWAVQFIRDTEGAHLRITALKVSATAGLSRAALYKPHLRPLWDSLWASNQEQYTEVYEIEELRRAVQQLEDRNNQLQSQLKNVQNQNEKLIRELEHEKTRSKVYRQDYENQKEQHQKLLHHNLRLLRKLHVYGIDMAEFDEEVQ